MDSYQFYKSLYDRELNRRIEMDKAINLPLTLLSIIFAANSYLIKDSSWLYNTWQVLFQKILILILSLGIGISIFYLTRSYNNLFKGYAYKNFGLTKEIRKYEMELNSYNAKVDKEVQKAFENIILEKLTDITDAHIVFNDKRLLDIYRAKTFLIVCIMLTIINFLIFSSKYLKYA